MAFASVHSCTLCGVAAEAVTVEVHTSGGLPAMSIVGLPQSAVKESKDRVRAAIEHNGYTYPQVKIIVNLAPADLPKRGGRFDLPIALGLLQATGQLNRNALGGFLVLGELGLTGQLRSVQGILPTALAFKDSALTLLIPSSNRGEAELCRQSKAMAFDHLTEVVRFLRERSHGSSSDVSGANRQEGEAPVSRVVDSRCSSLQDMSDVQGQAVARRAMEIAAAGYHHMLLSGPPGTGKSMLASRLPGIQPPMTEAEALESASVQSISFAGFDSRNWGVRPFRAPHHTASGVALVGGGSYPMPGEVSLAHQGVLFLDELPEFSRAVIDVLRQPIESGRIVVSRSSRQAEFPSRFQLVAAMNPCPCGYYGDHTLTCSCGIEQIARYQSRISGPLMDRIDLQLTVQREPATTLLATQAMKAEASQTIRERVTDARARQLQRQGCANALLTAADVVRYIKVDRSAKLLLKQAVSRLMLSLRAQHRVVCIARTIGDLAASDVIDDTHLAESLAYRKPPALNEWR